MQRGIRYRRFLVAFLLAETIPILCLVLLAHLSGPEDERLMQKHAETLGRFVGPIGGFICSFLFAKWLGLPEGPYLGYALAILDVILFSLMVLSGSAEFDFVIIVSNLGKIVAAYLGSRL